MNVDTGEIITYATYEEMRDFFRVKKSKKYVPLKTKNLSHKELEDGKVESKEIRDLLTKIGRSINEPRGVRRRLDKQLYKLRKKYDS